MRKIFKYLIKLILKIMLNIFLKITIKISNILLIKNIFIIFNKIKIIIKMSYFKKNLNI